jgi:hypothetical protein
MKKSTKKPVLSHADISKALQKFKEQGGLIKQLPEQRVLKGAMVGGKFGIYEAVFENGSGAGSMSGQVEAAAE